MTNEQLIQTAKEAMRNDTVLNKGIVELLCNALAKTTEQRDAVVAEMASQQSYKPSLACMMEALDAFYDNEDVPENGMIAAYEILKPRRAPATSAILDSLRAEAKIECLESLAGVAETMLVKFSNQNCSVDMPDVVGWKMVLRQAKNEARHLRESKGAQS